MKRKNYYSPEIEILIIETEGIMVGSDDRPGSGDIDGSSPSEGDVPSPGTRSSHFKTTQRQTFNRSFTRK